MKRKSLVILAAIIAAAVAVFLWHRRQSGGEEETTTVVRVHTGPLQTVTVHRYVDGFGTVRPAPAERGQPGASCKLAAGVAGTIAIVRAGDGDVVAVGAPLIDLDDRTAKAAVDRALRAEQAADAALKRQRELLAAQNSSVKAVQDAEAQTAAAEADLVTAQVQLSYLHITSPIAGTVVRLDARPGEAIDAATVLAEVIDLRRLVVTADIPAAEAGDIASGQDFEITSPAVVHGTVAWVGSTVDATLGTVTVRATLPAGAAVRPGQFVPVRILTGTHADVVGAPSASVVTDEDGQSTIAVVAGGQATQTPVQVGFREGDWVEVSADGLKAGETVVTTGAYGLPDKTKVEIER
ncbi:MAG TPA: efflux RND transporter periplasmic adaptor subunit [Opitutaceae bacterium]|jgi:cobalt-zinc-cadmium efflux system membrane fusion protein